jgi:hypothetical protein
MQRNIIILLAVLVVLLAAALFYLLLLRDQPRNVPIQINAAQENASEPYRQEMDCIDRLLQRNDMEANQVDAELAGCRGGRGNQSADE